MGAQVLKQTELEVFTKKKHENLTGAALATDCNNFYVLLPELTLLDDLRHRASMFCRIIADGTIRETGRLV